MRRPPEWQHGPVRTVTEPLSPRERQALTLWGIVVAVIGAIDFNQRGASTLSEAGRTVRRRSGDTAWTVGWALFAVWFWDHVRRH